MDAEWVWPAGAATGIGSLPGTDVGEALRLVFGELPDLPYLPELPGRGPGAELLGRTAGLLVELPVELYAARWRLTGRPGGDLRRTRDFLARDLDELVEVADGYAGVLKVAAGGPWTQAAGLDLPTGGAVLRDPGALRDLTDSLAEGLARHVADVSARVPGATVVLQLDEPSLPAVLAGRVATESGFGTYPAVPETDAAEVLRTVIDAVGVPVVVHCCAPDVPVGAIRQAGAAGLALDLAQLPTSAAGLDPLGEALDAGLGLLAGAVPTSGRPAEAPPTGVRPAEVRSAEARAVGRPAGAGSVGAGPDDAAAADAVRRLWHRLGLPAARLPAQVVVTQSCGLAGVGEAAARAALRAGRDAARRLADQPE